MILQHAGFMIDFLGSSSPQVANEPLGKVIFDQRSYMALMLFGHCNFGHGL